MIFFLKTRLLKKIKKKLYRLSKSITISILKFFSPYCFYPKFNLLTNNLCKKKKKERFSNEYIKCIELFDYIKIK